METTVFLFHPNLAILTSIRHWLRPASRHRSPRHVCLTSKLTWTRSEPPRRPVPYSVHDLLRPLQATSDLIGTEFAVPFVTEGASSISDEAINAQVKKYADYLSQEALPILNTFA